MPFLRRRLLSGLCCGPFLVILWSPRGSTHVIETCSETEEHLLTSLVIAVLCWALVGPLPNSCVQFGGPGAALTSWIRLGGGWEPGAQGP